MNTATKLQHELILDEYGLLANPEDWNENIALAIAKHNGINTLTSDHWKIIHALREHYARFGVAPTMHNICRSYGHKSNWAHDLFDTCLNAWRVAGLPDPGEEAKSYLSDM
jgi:TusE/DsrC/DsvC family sulfur relay protein